MDRRVVTVFGGSGFIGRHLVRRLAKDGWLVRVAVRDIEAAAFLKPSGDVGQIVLVPASVSSAETVRNAVDGAEAVINLVGILAESRKRSFQSVHVEGARTVAVAAAEAGAKRMVQVSAIGADTESDSAYARTKAEGEAAVQEAFPAATVVRPSVVFGPEDKFFNMFALMARLSPVLPVFGCPTLPRIGSGGETGKPFIDLYGDGGTRMQPVYVADVAEAIAGILSTPGTKGKTYELGGPQVLSFKEIMAATLQAVRRQRLLLPVPFGILNLQAWFMEKLPSPMLTRDQVKLLKRDNVVSEGALGFTDLGLTPTAIDTVLPTYLARFQPQWAQRRRV